MSWLELQNSSPMQHANASKFCCSTECFRCGEKSRFDDAFEAADNEDEAYSVMDNLKAAMGNK